MTTKSVLKIECHDLNNKCKTWHHKTLGENIGKKLADVNHDKFSSVSQGNRNKSKNEQIGNNQIYKLLYSKGNHKWNKTACRLRRKIYICKPGD